MQNTNTAIATTNAKDITPEYQSALQLHHEIMANIEIAGNAMIALCKCLKQMRDGECYKELGYTSFEEYAEQAVGIKKRQAYNYISVLEKHSSAFLQSNAQLGVTKLELLTQVPVLERDELAEEMDLAEMSTREIKELVEKYKEQGEQLSMLQTQNVELADDKKDLEEKNELLQQEKEKLETVSWDEAEANKKIAELQKKLKEAENRPVDVAVAEPDPAIIEKIKAEAQSEAEKKMEAAQKAAEKEAEKRFQQSLSVLESEKAQALARAQELENKLKVSGNDNTLRIAFLLEELVAINNKIHGVIKKVSSSDQAEADKYKQALATALDKLGQAIKTI